jgi:sorbitol/mannitol transport system permease protein
MTVYSSQPGASRTYMRAQGRLLILPATIMLLVCSMLPLVATLWFSVIDYRLLVPSDYMFVGLANYAKLLADPGFLPSLLNTLLLIAIVLGISVTGGLGVALLLDRAVLGKGILRILVISPFFVMPPVSALLWKNLLMQPVAGLSAWVSFLLGVPAFDWFAKAPLLAISVIVAWQWLPFACLILLTSLQSFDRDQREAAELDGASPFVISRDLILPHLTRPIAIVVMMETIFLLSLFAEIFVTTGGGRASSNLAYLVYSQVMLQYDVGAASAAGVVAIIFANILAWFLVRAVGRSLEA